MPPGLAVEPAPPSHGVPDAAPPTPAPGDEARRPTFVFFGVLAAISLLADVVTKAWAEVYFSKNIAGHTVSVIDGHLAFVLAYNKGGAWGLAHDASDTFRRPFFLLVSVAAIAFIVSLYNRLTPRQHALKWGLPLVLGGALGNLTDRIVRNQVIDFIDYRGDWVATMNELVAKYLAPGWSVTDHWPTFNVADVAICIGVGLMAVDMMTARRGREPREALPSEGAPEPAADGPEPPPAESGAPSLDRAEPAAPPSGEPAFPAPEAEASERA